MGFSVQVSEQALEIAGDDMDLAIEVAQGITAANQTQTEEKFSCNQCVYIFSSMVAGLRGRAPAIRSQVA